jgi:hypothetical protein
LPHLCCMLKEPLELIFKYLDDAHSTY